MKMLVWPPARFTRRIFSGPLQVLASCQHQCLSAHGLQQRRPASCHDSLVLHIPGFLNHTACILVFAMFLRFICHAGTISSLNHFTATVWIYHSLILIYLVTDICVFFFPIWGYYEWSCSKPSQVSMWTCVFTFRGKISRTPASQR